MQNPAYKKETALQNQKALLVQKRDRLGRLIALVDKTLKGERDMSFKQFDTTKIEEAKQQVVLFRLRRNKSLCWDAGHAGKSSTGRPFWVVPFGWREAGSRGSCYSSAESVCDMQSFTQSMKLVSASPVRSAIV